MLDRLPIHMVPRLDDWLGVWAMEPTQATALLAVLRGMNWPQHFATVKPTAMAPTSNDFSTVEIRGKQLAVIPLMGTLMKSRSSTGGTSTVETRRKIRAAAGNSEVAGILLQIDSPGGTVAGTDALASEIRAARKAKPVVAQIEDLGASAAYWIASQAAKVYASTATALVGSIGTLLTVTKGAPGEVAVFRSGPHKGAGLDGEITEEQAAHFQSLVDGLQQSFSQAVAQGRDLTAEQLAEVATGAIWTADRAKSLRLLDGVQPIERTLSMLASMGNKS